ncbi:hypothetical protein CRG98_000731 [Punica granatum]|uniref:Uncharacterized protein n=1 Tax=Punica granatum TaxID=22663 RepID=A0A2I0LDX9_PUNGR|nr:hypothetical protein CRG98_000731 [Punica granatum]
MTDNGSTLNLCPVSTLKWMNVDMSRIRARKMTVRAFDGSRREKLKFFTEGKLITVNGEEDYAIYKETAIPYVSIAEDQNLPFQTFDTISAIRDYGEVGSSRADRIIGKGILHPVEVEDYWNRRGLGFRTSCHEIVQALRSSHLHRLAAHYGKLSKGIPVPQFSQFFPRPPHVVGGTSNDPSSKLEDSSSNTVEALFALPAVYAIIEETSSGVPIRLA